ncbi:MAG: hypothetical protein HC842_06930, partial [Cytophagales bacterium]|nr:hypothetical protein [Cytophagales bacterium]
MNINDELRPKSSKKGIQYKEKNVMTGGKKWLILVFLLAIVHYSFGEIIYKTDSRFSHLTVKDGLPHNNVLCIYQDSHGFMWFGTENGLSRYDGYSVSNFSQRAFDSTTLPGNIVSCLLEDDRRQLWIGTNGGIGIYQRASETFQHITLGEEGSAPNYVLGLAELGKDTFYILSTQHLYRYTWKDKKMQVVPFSEPDMITHISTLHRYQSKLWLGGQTGIFVYDKEKHALVRPLAD